MRLNLKLFRRRPLLRALLAAAVIFGLGLAALMTASPSLHHHLHADSGEADHQCFATLVARGHVLSLDNPPVFVTAPPARVIETAFDAQHVFGAIQFLLPPGRGPPALS